MDPLANKINVEANQQGVNRTTISRFSFRQGLSSVLPPHTLFQPNTTIERERFMARQDFCGRAGSFVDCRASSSRMLLVELLKEVSSPSLETHVDDLVENEMAHAAREHLRLQA